MRRQLRKRLCEPRGDTPTSELQQALTEERTCHLLQVSPAKRARAFFGGRFLSRFLFKPEGSVASETPANRGSARGLAIPLIAYPH